MVIVLVFDELNFKNPNHQNDISSYNFLDDSFESKIKYYRIKAVDNNGKKHYTNLLSVDNRGNVKELVSVTNLLGQPASLEEKGQVLILKYSDGSSEKRMVVD